MGIFPKIRSEHSKDIWNHHLVIYDILTIQNALLFSDLNDGLMLLILGGHNFMWLQEDETTDSYDHHEISKISRKSSLQLNPTLYWSRVVG